MRLGELKKSLARMSPDLDDAEVLINTASADGEDEFDNLGFTAYADLPKMGIVFILGSNKAACERIKKGTLRNPDDTSPFDESFNLNE